MRMSDLNDEIKRELANLQGELGSMIRSIDDNLPPAFVPLFLHRLDSLIAQARAALSFLDKEDMGNFIESFGATLENVESQLKRRKRPN
jgi:hypothetical protein